MLKAGLYQEFFTAAHCALIPFLKPSVYGRSTVENSSFLASSANPDPSLHGRGCVARLSGSTVEMLDIWFHMSVGENPFTFTDNMLMLCFKPVLPDWLFDESGTLSFTFLSQVKVTYHNPNNHGIYGENSKAGKITVQYHDGHIYEQTGYLTGEAALSVRSGLVDKIDVHFS